MPPAAARNNFLDILLDPMAIAIVASIALHASLGAGLPFLIQPNKDGKKAGTDAVKVVELTPSEVQRIPQVKPEPVPTPQATTPAATPAPAPTTAPQPPQTPKFSTAPITIPFSPIRSPQSAPSTAPQQPNPGKKDQRPIAQKQPPQPIFDPDITFTPSPTPTPTKSPAPQGAATKPTAPKGSTPKPTSAPTAKPSPATTDPKVKKNQAATTPARSNDTDPDSGGEGAAPQPKPSPGKPRAQGQKPAGGSPAGTSGKTTVQGNNPGGDPDGNETGFYGKYTQAANAKLQDYLRKYPGIVQYPPKKISQQYPPGVPCSKVKQPPFIVLMVAFDKVPEGQDSNILGNTTSPLMDNERPYINGDPATLANKKLIEMATTAGFVDATAADKKRPASDRGKPVLYSYRVQFDPASCKY